MATDSILKRIRTRFEVPAYHGVKIKTSAGEIGVIAGGEGTMLKIWFESSKKFKYVNPDEVAYVGITIKK